MRRLQRKDTWRLGIRIFLFLAVLLFLIKTIRAEIVVNEIMYDYPGSDSNHEWIDIYNNGSEAVNLSGWKFREGGTDHSLTLNNGSYILNASEYAVIADDAATFLTDYFDFNSTLLDSSFDLSNSGEELLLKNKTLDVVFNMTYNVSLGAAGNNKTLCIFNGTWQECIATPGAINNISVQTNQTNATLDVSMSVYLSDIINIDVLYDNLFKFEILNKADCSAKDNVTFYFNITNASNSLVFENTTTRTDIGCSAYANTGELTMNLTGNYTICGRITNSTINDTNPSNDFACKNFTVIDTRSTPCNISINLTSDKTIYLTNESIAFSNNLNDKTFPYKIEYWKEDLFGTQIGSRTNTTNTNQKTWSPSIDELDQAFFIKNRIAYVACNDTNSADDYSEKMVVVRGTNRTDNSVIQIDEVYLGTDNKAKFGDSLRFKVIIYKGNSTKTSVQAWLESGGEKISKTTSTNIYGNYQNHTITMPVQIEANCNGAISDGNYNLVVEGLNASDRETVYVEGTTSSLCQTVTRYSSSSDTGSQTPLNIEQESETPITSFVYDKVRFNIASPTMIEFGKEFIINITAANTADDEKELYAWAYIFKGRKSITNPMQNRKHLALSKNESMQIYLPVVVEDENIDPGDYKLMVKLNSSARKSLKSVSKAVELIFNQEYAGKKAVFLKSEGESAGKTQAEFDSESFNNGLEFDSINKVTGSVVLNADVYESTTVKAKKLVKYFIVSAFGLFVIMLIWRKV
ncbi:lamin tail domain-containing protein [Candidatus Woesearchaeota archaeon]|nr:lamin tail domain-containing protein [Candidatus Woesearchaeota archaeon]